MEGEYEMSRRDPQLWSLEEIYKALLPDENNKKQIVVPMFQRGKRWNKDKEDVFIDSLENNYPIGSLLFYENNNPNNTTTYTLIDGLQRSNTIRKYLSAPTKYFKVEKLEQDFLDKCVNFIGSATADNQIIAQKKGIKDLMINYIRSLKSLDDFRDTELVREIKKIYPIIENNNEELLQDYIYHKMREYNLSTKSLNNVKVPVIVYAGDESTLTDIFTRINSKGVPLTPYEIYAASWPDQKFHINNNKILEYIIRKYRSLTNDDFIIQGYDENLLREKKQVNAFDYMFGLSKFLDNKYEIFNFKPNIHDDEVNVLGFELLNACFNSTHGDIKNTYKIIIKFQDRLDDLEKRIFKSIEFVEKAISKITYFKGNNRSKLKRFHSQFQILSMVSFVFRERYDLETLNRRPEWKENESILNEMLWKYYVYDIVSEYWRQDVTQNIHNNNKEKRYLNQITIEEFSIALEQYYHKSKNRREIKKVTTYSNADYVILNTVYVEEFTASQQLSPDFFDIEHISTKDKMKKHAEQINMGLPISSIANLCYLPETANRSKGAKTFYEDENYLKKSGLTIEEIENKYSFTTKESLEWINKVYDKEDSSELIELYNDFLDYRFKIIKDKMLKSMGFIVNY